jgi:hypothetical protein
MVNRDYKLYRKQAYQGSMNLWDTPTVFLSSSRKQTVWQRNLAVVWLWVGPSQIDEFGNGTVSCPREDVQQIVRSYFRGIG